MVTRYAAFRRSLRRPSSTRFASLERGTQQSPSCDAGSTRFATPKGGERPLPSTAHGHESPQPGVRSLVTLVGQGEGGQGGGPKISAAFVPPKPNELESA
jgi:hypothetical protein